jgi:arylsulfatase A-like enzyme
MTAKNSTLLLASLLAAGALLPAPLRAAGRPNILFLLSDDQRPDAIHALGNRDLKTPNLDGLVRNGFAFTRAYCMGSSVGAVCVCTRAMLMTGRTLWRAPRDMGDFTQLPAVLRQDGYDTLAAGKWHNEKKSFARAGFTDGEAIFFGGMLASHFSVPITDFDPTGRYDRSLTRTTNRFSTFVFADAAVDFLHRHPAGKPFFLYVAFNSPHDPRTPPPPYDTMYDPEKLALPKNFLPAHPFDNGELNIRDEQLVPRPRTPADIRRQLAAYYGMISCLDVQVGRILQALQDTGQAENTLIVFASDHGLSIGSHGLLGKQNLYQESMGTPLIFSGPGIPRGKRSDALCYLLDVYPTLAELAGATVPATVEGRSLVPVITGKQPAARDALLLAYRDVQRAVVTERWKLIAYPKVHQLQLFDLRHDPQEIHNLAGDPKQAARVAALQAKMTALEQAAGDPDL